jgi:hypothetical protein
MKKLPVMVVLFDSLLIASIALTAISFLAKLVTPDADLQVHEIIQGNLLSVLTTPLFWAAYPSIPSLSLLLNPSALLLIGLLVATVFYLLQTRLKASPLAVSAALILTALVPTIAGRLALSGNTDPATAGIWLAFMLSGVLYSATACALYNIMLLVNTYPSTQETIK